MLKGSSGDVGDNKQLPQPLQREATPPPRGPTWATDSSWLQSPAKSVAAGDNKKVYQRHPSTFCIASLFGNSHNKTKK